MSQYNKLSDIQYARFQILPVDLHFGLLVSWYPHHVLAPPHNKNQGTNHYHLYIIKTFLEVSTM